MSAVSRRQVLGGVALAGAAGAFATHRFGGAGKQPHVIVFDSQKPASRAFAHDQGGTRRIDLALERGRNWSGVRAVRKQGPVAGLTSWNDYVAARGWLEERGLRLASERRDPAHDLIAWTMV